MTKILWMTWRDPAHPLRGGAEVVQDELTRRLVDDGHEVIVLTSTYDGASHDERLGGRHYIRTGNKFTVYWHAYRYYRKNLRGWADIVIDEVNTVPFFAKFYVRESHIMLIHQLAREIWFYELPPVIGWIGYVLEPLYIRILKGQKVITVSDSTKNDLLRYGHNDGDIAIISEGLHIKPVARLSAVKKYASPTLLIHGSVRAMKRTLDTVRAFEIAKDSLPDLSLKVSGDNSGSYGQIVGNYIAGSRYTDSIEYLGRTTDAQKIQLMQRCHAILVASVREGWGLIVTEANSQGSPAVVYDVPGLRDSVQGGVTGEVCAPRPEAMAAGIIKLLQDPRYYTKLQRNAYEWSKAITFEQSYNDFKGAIGL